MQKLLDVQSVVVGYDRPLHLPLTFNICAGDIVLLHGENGAGKSSFIGALAKTVTVWQGQIQRADRLRIALQSQQPVQRAGFPLSVQEYLTVLGCTGKLPERLQIIGQSAIADLSYGQMHLLSIWSAIHSRAQLVLLDEPTNHLDADARRLVSSWLADLRADQAALIVSHDVDLIQHATQHIEVIAQCA